jgi:hypothetical protein
MKKVTKKSSTSTRNEVVTVDLLENILDDRFNKSDKKTDRKLAKLENKIEKRFEEQTQIILAAVNTIVKQNIEDSERRMLAYTELRTQEILDVFKDDRVENRRRFAEHDLRISTLENKVATLKTT